jgi:hypothetical protein
MTPETPTRLVSPFNGPVEIGLRALCVLTTAFPACVRAAAARRLRLLPRPLRRHPGGPEGLHPQTPHRGGEILVRRGVLQALALYESRGLIERVYKDGGIFFSGNRQVRRLPRHAQHRVPEGLRERADWVVDSFGLLDDAELDAMVRDRIGTWGAEFSMESVLWTEEAS